MFERTIWDKVLECIFENFEISISKFFKNHEGDLCQGFKIHEDDYWSITPKQKTLCIETNRLIKNFNKNSLFEVNFISLETKLEYY